MYIYLNSFNRHQHCMYVVQMNIEMNIGKGIRQVIFVKRINFGNIDLGMSKQYGQVQQIIRLRIGQPMGISGIILISVNVDGVDMLTIVSGGYIRMVKRLLKKEGR
mmetsp:Transcript_22819/g.27990  ORF Transcript_22819/g.27990 Transcript_22819/m.27990 type:complete len:106 (-) Transcript_22819:184-501(-)